MPDIARERLPDMVLIDIGLSRVDDYEVARRLGYENCYSDSLIIAVSGYSDAPARGQGREVGFGHHLMKPVDINTIVDLAGRGRRSGG